MIRELTNKEYHSIDTHKGSSTLKAWRINPFKASYDEFKRKSEKWIEPEWFTFGNYYHAYINEPDIIDKEFFIFDKSKRPFPDSTFAKKENKQWKEDIFIEAESNGKKEFSLDQNDVIYKMKEVLFKYKNGYIKNIIQNFNSPEQSIFIDNFITLCSKNIVIDHNYIPLFNNKKEVVAYCLRDSNKKWLIYPENFKVDQNYVLNAKIRPDINTKSFIGDLKTCNDNSIDGWQRQIKKFDYDLQAAYYHDVYECFTGIDKPFIWISQEKSEPYNPQTYNCNDDWIEAGRNKYLYGAYRMLKYQGTGVLEGYNEEEEKDIAIDCSCPPWSRL